MDFFGVLGVLFLFCCLGGSCSLAGTWWSRKKKDKNKDEKRT